MEIKDDVVSFTRAVQNAIRLIPGVKLKVQNDDNFVTETIYSTTAGNEYRIIIHKYKNPLE